MLSCSIIVLHKTSIDPRLSTMEVIQHYFFRHTPKPQCVIMVGAWYLVLLLNITNTLSSKKEEIKAKHPCHFKDFRIEVRRLIRVLLVCTGRGMNAAFAIGRLCDLECGRSRLLTLPESEKMVNIHYYYYDHY